MTLYEEIINYVRTGSKFRVDLINKSLCIDKRKIIEGGVFYDRETKLIDSVEDCWSEIERLYRQYKHSRPKMNGNRKSYFKALDYEELTDAELAYNEDRDVAQAMLECFILLASMSGMLTWYDDRHWFYQGKDKCLIVLKQWI